MKDSSIKKIGLIRDLIYQINEEANISFVFAFIDSSSGENNINISASVFDMIEAEDMLDSIHSILDQMGPGGQKIDLSNYSGKIGEA